MKTYPLTQSQLGIFLEWINEPSMTKYNLPSYIPIKKPADAQRYLRTLQKVVAKRDTLSTRFVMEDGLPRQYVDLQNRPEVEYKYLTKEELQKLKDGAWVRPYDLLNGPASRFLIAETEDEVCIFQDVHHIIADGYSLGVLYINDFQKSYNGEEMAEESVNIRQVAEQEELSFEGPKYEKSKAYFVERMAGQSFASLAKAVNNPWGHLLRQTCYIDSKEVNEWCKEQGVYESVLFNAAFSFVLSQLMREQNVCYTILSHGRDADTKNSYGMFVHSMPFVSEINMDSSVRDLFLYTREEQRKTFRHNRKYPFTHLCRDLKLVPGIEYNFLAAINAEEIKFGDVKCDPTQLSMDWVDRDLNIDIYQKNDEYEIRSLASDALYDSDTLMMISQAILDTVKNMMANPDAKLSELSIVGDEVRDKLMQISTGKHLDVDITKTFAEVFENRAIECPESIAVVDSLSSITYAQLSQRSNMLAHLLIAEGVKPNDFVCVMLDRKKEFPVSVLAIHKAGAAYTPLDYEYPNERLSYMLENSESKVLVTTHDVLAMKQQEGQFETGNAKVIFLDDLDWDNAAEAEAINLTTPDNLAYMIYTSGSTGKPKGAMLHQAGLWNFINIVIDMEHLTADDRIEGHRSFSFDAHIEDMYAILTLGGSFHIMPSEIRKDPEAMYHFIIDHKITGGGYSTAVAALLLNTYPDMPVRFITAGGEKLEGVYSDHIEIINVYGPTECTDDTSYYKILPGQHITNIPIGKSVANTYNFIVGTNNQLLPPGVAGELCFAGIQVGKGYWKLPERTAQAFCDCPFVEKDAYGRKVRMYHTGDLCRWNKDGDLEYISRIDTQVKLRGFRIELGEIEGQAMKFDGMLQVAAEVRKIGVGEHLCLYFSSVGNKEIDHEVLKRHMESSSLADYMVPTLYMQMEKLPLTPNGKINRKKLPTPALAVEKIVAPETEEEKNFFGIVSEMLRTDQFGVTTNLISVGLTSLISMKMSAKLKQELGITLTTKQILTTPTIRELIETAKTAGEHAEVKAFPKQEYYPLSESVRALYFDWEEAPEAVQYNVPRVSTMEGIDAERLQKALVAAVNAHPFLKMRIESANGEVKMLRRDDAPVHVDIQKATEEPTKEFFQTLVKPFDLKKDDLYRLAIYEYDGKQYVFTDFHHIVLDGTSQQIFWDDVERAYDGEELPTEKFTAFDRALEEEQLTTDEALKEDDAYFDSLMGDKSVTIYPYSAKPDCTANGETMRHAWAEVDGEGIQIYCREHGLTESNYFLTVTMLALQRLTNQSGIVLTANTNGRSASHLQQTVGMFVKSLPLAMGEEDVKSTLAETVKTIQAQTQHTYSLDHYPFMRLAQKYSMRSEVVYLYQGGINDAEYKMGGKKFDSYFLTLNSAKDPLTIEPYPNDKGNYVMLVEYDGSLFGLEDMTRLANCLKTVAEEAVKHEDDLKVIPLLSDADEKKMLQTCKGKTFEYNADETWVDLFMRQVKANPDATAVVDANGSLTYGELNELSDKFRTYISNNDIHAGDFIAIRMDRDKRFMAAALGAHKAGVAYTPIDKEYPEERVAYMLEDSAAKLVVNEDIMDEVEKEAYEPSAADFALSPDAIAYMIYTSGSTGKPKGVMIQHKALLNFVYFIAKEWGHTEKSRIACHSNFAFDAAVEDLYPVLTVGGALYIMPENVRKDMQLLHQYIIDNGITGGCYTTQLGQMLLQLYPDLPVDYLVVGGEKMTAAPDCKCRLINTYGPTEFTVDATFYDVEKGREYKNIPIGRPLYNLSALVVDKCGHLVPQGIAGELCMTGSQMALGYKNRDELTEKAFAYIRSQNIKVYHTGDLVRYNEEGQLEYLGRIDSQVKLRGFRIELGEIESQIANFPGIQMESVQVKEVGGVQHLCAYYTADRQIDTDALRSSLANVLADYMVPTAYMQLEEMPLTPNGKVNVKALPVPEIKAEEIVAPETEMEKSLFDITAELLKHSQFGVTSNLISMGLTSLSMMRLSAMITQKYEVMIKVTDILANPTIRNIIDIIEEERKTVAKKNAIFTKRTSANDTAAAADAPKANPFAAKKANPFEAKKSNPFKK